jgi:hypothetical protein
VVFRQIQDTTDPRRDKAVVGLKRTPVLASEVILIGNGTPTARGLEVTHSDGSTEEGEEFAFLDGLHMSVAFDYITKIVIFPVSAASLALGGLPLKG